jgi:5,10-methenyltetrahydrofolate synthetase
MTKRELRQQIRTQKRRLSAAELAVMSEDICSKVLALVSWQEAGTLLLYYPLPDEVDVRLLIKDAFESGKKVLLPVVKGDELELHLYEGEASLKEGAFGIMEPTGPLFAPIHYDEIELAIIPGMAFDSAGHRLGRGKGYYDRLLPNLRDAKLIGVCFPFQFLEEVPAEAHDISVCKVIC